MMNTENDRGATGPMGSVSAIIRMRCPECRRGITYRNGMEMNRLCPSCGIAFEREPGYFTGAIWIASILAMPVMFLTMFGLLWFFRDMHPAAAGGLAALLYLPLAPLTVKLSRSIWMYLDHQMNPEEGERRPPDDPLDPGTIPPVGSPGYSVRPITEPPRVPVDRESETRHDLATH